MTKEQHLEAAHRCKARALWLYFEAGEFALLGEEYEGISDAEDLYWGYSNDNFGYAKMNLLEMEYHLEEAALLA
jgi:hypothetical protein